MKVITISSLKGGVGKTFFTLGLASACNAKGLKTLIVDLDPQSDTTGFSRAKTKKTIADIFQRPSLSNIQKSISSVNLIGDIDSNALDIISGSPALIKYDTPSPASKDIWVIDKVLKKIEKLYDIVLIDTPPSLNALTRNAYIASDEILLITEPSAFSVSATDRAVKAVKQLALSQHISLNISSVIINRFNKDIAEHIFRVDELKEMYPNLINNIIFENDLSSSQANGAGQLIHLWPSNGAIELSKKFSYILDEILNR